MNKFILDGIVEDIQLRETRKTQLCKIIVRNIEYDYNQVRREEFFEAVAFGRTGEIIAKYFQKGKPILLEGKMRRESYKNQFNQKVEKTVLIVEGFSFVPDGCDFSFPNVKRSFYDEADLSEIEEVFSRKTQRQEERNPSEPKRVQIDLEDEDIPF